jgi:hypothetical protein
VCDLYSSVKLFRNGVGDVLIVMHVVWYRGSSVYGGSSNLMMEGAGASKLYGNTLQMTIILIFVEGRTLNLTQ